MHRSDRLRSGEPTLGVFTTTGSPLVAEFVAAGGVDAVVIDLQHGIAGRNSTVATFQALTGQPVLRLVRTPLADEAALEWALDAGADGVIVPGIENASQAAAAAGHVRYPPAGVRSFGPVRAELDHGLDPGAANASVLCFVMIETAAGVAAADEICATEGVDGVFIGPADLAVSLGLPPSLASIAGAHADAISLVLDACLRNGRLAGIHAGNGAQARERFAEGFHLVTASTDLALLRWAVRRSVRDARG